jgi:hypothetical protein
MGYDTFYLGWAAETTEGTSLITGAGDTAYIWGSVAENTPLFDPVWATEEPIPDYGERYQAAELTKTIPSTGGQAFAFLPRNGIPFYYVMGKSSTAATVHTLTTQSQSSGVIAELPTLTFHAERIDSDSVLSDWSTQYKGMKNAAARIFVGDDTPTLTCVFGWVGMSVADPAFVLTSKPSNPTGTYTAPGHYNWPSSTHKYGTTPATVEGVTGWELRVTNGTYAIPPQYGDTFAHAVYQGAKQLIELDVTYRPQAQTLHDDLLSKSTQSKDWEFEFVRHATDDKLKFYCHNAVLIDHPTIQPVSADGFVTKATFRLSQLTITVTDQINASFYGE